MVNLCLYFYCAGRTWGQLHSQLSEVVSQTAIGDVLGSVGEAECEEFFQHYLHDFVRSVYRCYHKQQKSKNLEYKVGLRMIEFKCIQTSRGIKCSVTEEWATMHESSST